MGKRGKVLGGGPITTVLACAVCFAAGATAVSLAGSGGAPHKASKILYLASDGTRIGGVKLTGLGLPNLGGTSTYGIAELATSAASYHDSGAYDKDLAKVGSRAKRSLLHQLKQLRRNPGPGAYSACSRVHGKRKCHKVKPAMVLDIDETSLSNYSFIQPTFSQLGLITAAVAGTSSAIEPTLDLYKLARKRGVKVAFITGRPDLVSSQTESNLTNVGYADPDVTYKPSGPTTIAYKSGARKALVKKGYRILINLGDQDSDLKGGYAKRAFKYPNPFYFIP